MIIQLIIFGALGSLPFLKGLNEAENLSKCGDEASCPCVFLHMTTRVFREWMALFTLLRAKPSSPTTPPWSWHKAVLWKKLFARQVHLG